MYLEDKYCSALNTINFCVIMSCTNGTTLKKNVILLSMQNIQSDIKVCPSLLYFFFLHCIYCVSMLIYSLFTIYLFIYIRCTFDFWTVYNYWNSCTISWLEWINWIEILFVFEQLSLLVVLLCRLIIRRFIYDESYISSWYILYDMYFKNYMYTTILN